MTEDTRSGGTPAARPGVPIFGVEHFAQMCDALRAENERLGAEIARLTAERDDAYDTGRRILMEEPQKNGEFAHLVICSGDRRQPPGRTGISCCCPIGKEARRVLGAEVASLREASKESSELLAAWLTAFANAPDVIDEDEIEDGLTLAAVSDATVHFLKRALAPASREGKP